MSAENGYTPGADMSGVYRVEGDIAYGRGHEPILSAAEMEKYTQDRPTFVESLRRVPTQVRLVGEAAITAVRNLGNREIPLNRRTASGLTALSVALQLGASLGEAMPAHAQSIDDHNNSDTSHHLQLDALPTYGIALEGDLPGPDLEGGDGGPDPDDEDPTAIPNSTSDPEATVSSGLTATPEKHYAYLPIGLQVQNPNLPTATAEPPTKVPSPTPSSTNVPPSPSPSPSATPSPTDLPPTPVPTVAPLFDGMIAERVFEGKLGGVELTTGGISTYAASETDPQIVGLPGTAGYLENGEATGFVVDVEARPMIAPIPDVSNLTPDIDPSIRIGATVLNPSWKEAEVVQAASASFDWEATPPQWVINGEAPCDDDPNIDQASGPLVSPSAVISMMAEEGVGGGRTNTIQIDADGNVCAEVIAVPPALNPYQESNAAAGTVVLPQNTKGYELRGTSVLRSSEATPLMDRYPALQAVEDYRNETGRQMWAYIRGGNEVGQGVTLWGNPDAFAAFREGFLQGIIVTPDREWLSYSPDLGPTDLTLAVAQEQGWQAITSSGVSSYHGTYGMSLESPLPSENPSEHPARVKRFLQDAYGIGMTRWNAGVFPGIDIMPYANPANDIAASTIRRSYFEPVPIQQQYTESPKVAMEVGLEALVNWRERNGFGPLNNLTIEQRAMLINANIRANLPRTLQHIDGGVFPDNQVRLIFPIGDEGGAAPDNWRDILNKLGNDYRSYGEVVFPVVLPDGNKRDRYGPDMLQAVVARPDANMRIVAIPPALGNFRGPGDIMSAPFFRAGMGQAVQAMRDARGGAQ